MLPTQSVDAKPDTGPALAATGRVAAELLAQLDPVAFDPQRLVAALAAFPVRRGVGQDTMSGRGLGFNDGRTFRLAAAPGLVSLQTFDAVRRERTCDRDRDRTRRDADLLAVRLLEDGEFPEHRVTRYISAWSAKSRTRMAKVFASLDWSDLLADVERPLGMITLTYPGDWLTVCPSGRELKRQLRVFLERWRRATGSRLIGGWKLEFQRRGAPHVHIITGIPAMVGGEHFNTWLSRTWASIVDARDPGERLRHLMAGTAVDFRKTGKMTDPKRLAVYFLGHSAKGVDGKEYQHQVPDEWQDVDHAPGRFWGFWGLPKAIEQLDLDVHDFITVRRTLRKVAAGRARRIAHDRAYWAARKEGWPHEFAARIGRNARAKRLRSLGVGGQMSGGFVIVNDGARLAADLARAVMAARGSEHPVYRDGVLIRLSTGELVG